MTSPVPAEVLRLIEAHLDTMWHVDALASLARAPEGLTAAELADDAFMSLGVATACLQDLAETGLAAVAETSSGARYRFASLSAPDHRAVDALIMWRNTRPVSLVRFIYGRPADSLE